MFALLKKSLLIIGLSMPLIACQTIHSDKPSVKQEPETHILKVKTSHIEIIAESNQYQYVFRNYRIDKTLNQYRQLVAEFEPHLDKGWILIRETQNSDKTYTDKVSASYFLVVNENGLNPEQKTILLTQYKAKPYPIKSAYEKAVNKQLEITFEIEGQQKSFDSFPLNQRLSDEYKLAQPIPMRKTSPKGNNEVGTLLFVPFYIIGAMFGCLTSNCI